MEGYSKWKRVILIALGILLLILMGITAGGRSRISFLENTLGDALSPVQGTVNSVSNAFYGKITPFFEVWDTLAENNRLKKENITLRSQIIGLSLKEKEFSELKNLEGALKYVKAQNLDNFVTADVIGKNPGNWYNMFVVNVGKKNGVTRNSTVIDGNGLVGTVYEVGDNWAKVVSVIDNKCSISFETVDPTASYEGIVTGSVDSTVKGQLFDPQAKVSAGQTLITSGLGVHPKGVLIGTVKSVVKSKDDLLLNVVVEPAVNFRKIDKVMIIPNLTSLYE